MTDLPPDLRSAVEARVTGPARARRDGMQALARTYRAGGRSDEGIDFDAYLAARLPATFAAVSRALDRTMQALPDFAPRSVLDVGAGPGTAAWAAVTALDSVTAVTFIDSNPAFLRLALDLSAASDHPALRGAAGTVADMGAVAANGDLVIAAYALAEVPLTRVGPIARHLWSRTAGVLLLVEPGTPAGADRIRAARAALLEGGARLAAPCPHADACPMTAPEWCHFTVRLQRSRLHRQTKAATLSYEDEPFAFVAVSHGAATPARARIVAPPEITKPGVRLRLCTPDGLRSDMVDRRDPDRFRRARKAGWGDPFDDQR